MKSSFPSDGSPPPFVLLIRGAIGQGRRFVRFLWNGLQAAGSMYVGPLPAQEPDPVAEPPRPLLDEPPAGHPERLAPSAPLSRTEADLWARFYSDT
ncbi:MULTISPECIES: DUF6059 family protein [unclassified Streptomyces]|uniref:DUF6059 family protein n=1 Tax=unclassified Streptomyces TaxID=2593676 RepID=UPI002E181F28|nr:MULTISPECIES: DUF6059 family protein [unclassified Streptomyces]